jgi:hypothetical protein
VPFSGADSVISKACGAIFSRPVFRSPGERSCAASRRPAASLANGAGAQAWGLPRRLIAPVVKSADAHSLRRAPANSKPRIRWSGKKMSVFQKRPARPQQGPRSPWRFGVLDRQPPPCPQASLTTHAVRGSLPLIRHETCDSVEVRAALSASVSSAGEAPIPAPRSPQGRGETRRAARAHARSRGLDFTSRGGETPPPGLRRQGIFGRSPSVQRAIGMRPDRVDERLERLAANRSG